MTASKINARIAALFVALEAANLRCNEIMRDAEAATVLSQGCTFDEACAHDDEAVADAWALAEIAAQDAAGLAEARAMLPKIEREIFEAGLELATACAKTARRALPALIVTMYADALSGRMSYANRNKVLAHLRENAGKQIA